jgi:hypothetical protein
VRYACQRLSHRLFYPDAVSEGIAHAPLRIRTQNDAHVLLCVSLPLQGHLFCWHCISKVKSKSCPTCRGEFSPSSLQVCRFVERQIAAKQAHCRFRASGCVRKGPLGAEGRTLLAHTPTCEYRTFDCQRCGAAVKPVDARKHAERECLIRDPSAQAAAPAAAPAAKSSRSRSCKRKREAPPNQEKEQEGPQVPPQAAVAATAAASSSRQTRSQSRKEQQNLR